MKPPNSHRSKEELFRAVEKLELAVKVASLEVELLLLRRAQTRALAAEIVRRPGVANDP